MAPRTYPAPSSSSSSPPRLSRHLSWSVFRIGSICAYLGDPTPDSSAIEHAFSSRSLVYLCSSLKTARHALKPCSSYLTDSKILSMTPAHDGPTRRDHLLIRSASQSL